MPRTYKCRNCGIVHQPPTGKHCQHRDDHLEIPNETQNEGGVAQLLPLLTAIGQRMDAMDQRMDSMRNTGATESIAAETGEVAAAIETALHVTAGDSDDEAATPESLRKDRELMADAARRLRRLELVQQDEEDLRVLGTTRAAGKRSGSVMTATDKVLRTVDWLHMHVRRMVAGKRKGIHFNELKVEEFVYGFLSMIQMPGNDMDFRGMLRILHDIMQDAMEFSWANARSFYEQVGLEVEWGTLKWTDEERIKHLRMTYARTVFPVRKEGPDTPKPNLVPAPPGTKCCVPYQRHACENDKDHQPFVHACAYCLKTKSAICRHPENDCYRKTTDASKNGKPREPASSLA